jgi:dTDP-3-amino-3,4,6-trideoxy-alpha-D-glucose transaminase
MTTVSSTSVPFMDLSRQHGPLAGELRDAFDRVLGSNGFILGSEVEQFELEFAEYCGTRHTIGVASGTAALTITLQAAGIGPGDEVIVPAHTFIASALAVIHAGASPVCAEVDPGTGLLDADAVVAAIGPRTAAVLAVHLYGQPCDMNALLNVTQPRGLALFEDAAQAHGATYRGRRAGGLGTAGAFSFYPSKNLGALGDGGAICTDDDELAAAARKLRDLGRSGPTHDVVGYNERLDGLQAAWLSIKLRHLDDWNAARRELAASYRGALGQLAEPLSELPESKCNYHLYPIRLRDRDAVGAALAARGISTGVHYPLALPDQPSLPMLHGSDTPHARRWAAQELSLPIFPGMTATELEIVTTALQGLLGDA